MYKTSWSTSFNSFIYWPSWLTVDTMYMSISESLYSAIVLIIQIIEWLILCFRESWSLWIRLSKDLHQLFCEPVYLIYYLLFHLFTLWYSLSFGFKRNRLLRVLRILLLLCHGKVMHIYSQLFLMMGFYNMVCGNFLLGNNLIIYHLAVRWKVNSIVQYKIT